MGDAKLGMAEMLTEMDHTDQALAMLEQSVQLEPTNAVAHYRLGMLYKKKGRVEDAKREVDLYRKLKEMKERLRSLYKELQIQPSEIRADVEKEK
jgi:DNA-binding SARP family transcriptional activator